MDQSSQKSRVAAYWYAFALLLVGSIAIRALYASWYPFGYAGHSLIHYHTTRLPIYKFLFMAPWTPSNRQGFLASLLNDQHGPQSLIEALLTPIFGFGLTETRLIVATLGISGILLAMYWGSLVVNRWFGLAVGLALSFSPHNLIFSLSGESEHINVYWCTFLVLVSAQLVLQRGRVVHFALLGFATGLTMYVYAPAIILGPMVAGLLLLFSGNPFRVPLLSLFARVGAYTLPAILMILPYAKRALREGKAIPVRAPIQTEGYQITELERLWSNVNLVRYELFSTSTDPWFNRSVGGLADPTIFLVIPGLLLFLSWGLISVSRWLAPKRVQAVSWSSRERMFAVACVLGLTVLGIVPAILSPYPYFRRLIVTSIGVTIFQAAGIYLLVWIVARYLGRIIGGLVGVAIAGAYCYNGWHVFRYDVKLADNSLTFESVEMVREVSRRVSEGRGAVILLPVNIQKLYPTEIKDLLRMEYGFDEAVPPGIRTIFFSDSIEGPIQEAIMPFDPFRFMEKGGISRPERFDILNPRPIKNREREAFVVVDLVPK